MPKPAFLLSNGLMCDARVKWFQALGRYLDAPVWMMDSATPGVEEWFSSDTQKNVIDFVKKEITGFIAFLEKITGKKFDWDKYDETINDMIELCRIVNETFELRKAVPCPMHSKDFWSTMPSFLFLFGDLKDTIQCFKNMNSEIQQRIDNKIGAVNPEKYRLIFGDIPPWHSLDFFDRLAERGWNFVSESWGYNPPPLPFPSLETIDDPLERHARFHLHFLTGKYKETLENDQYLGYIGYPYLILAEKFKCDGAFWHPLITCRSASTHHPYVSKLLLEKAKIPSIVIEGDLVDLRLFDPEEALVKAETFEEIMDYYKSLRAK
jgi:benzoyl-CoA reductase/2-hydroxyglutaryl-CoA dehydratase subunit BcrC/BadD/HgdB